MNERQEIKEKIEPELKNRRCIWDIQKWNLEMQIKIQHLLHHKDQECMKEDEEGIMGLCYPDFAAFICPRCWNGPKCFEPWNQTDEHDTYFGFKCRHCNYSYCISH